MTYSLITKLRDALLQELREEFFGIPFTVDHHKLVEMRVQTALMLSKDDISNEINKETDRKKKVRLGDKK